MTHNRVSHATIIYERVLEGFYSLFRSESASWMDSFRLVQHTANLKQNLTKTQILGSCGGTR
jgi:hypothetical protein